MNRKSDTQRYIDRLAGELYSIMISDTTLTNLSNGLGVAAMACIVLYHFIAVNGKRMEE